MRAKDIIPASKPRNFVAKNQKTAGAGAHKDKKKAEKQGDVKHKGKQFDEGYVMEYETHRYTDDQGNEWEVDDEGNRELIGRGGRSGSTGYTYRKRFKPVYNKPKGYYFYNVPAGKESDARAAGLRQSKSGKWFDTMTNSVADKVFGKGRYWEPKN